AYSGVRQSDGKFVVTGFSNGDFAAARFTIDGRVDSTYGISGKTIVSIQANDIPYASAIQPDNKVVIVGTSTVNGSEYDFVAIRLKTDGTPDSTFGTNGRTVISLGGYQEARGVVIQPDGKIIIAGFANSPNNAYPSAIFPMLVRLTANGVFDQTFNNGNGWSTYGGSLSLGYSMWVYSVALQSDGKIVIAGTTNSVGLGAAMFVFRFNANGTIDNTLNSDNSRYSKAYGDNAGAKSVAIQLDGKFILTGHNNSDFYLARFFSNGSYDNSFGSVSNGIVLSLTTSNNDEIYASTITNDGKVLVVGAANGNYGMARYTSSGAIDNSFGTNGTVVTDLGAFDEAYAVFTDSLNGKITVLGRSGDNFVAMRFHGYTTTSPVPTVPATSITTVLATQTTATIRWTKGNGSNRILLGKVDAPVAVHPVDGSTYSASSTYGSGTLLSDATYPLYDGTDSVVTIQGLVIGKTYYFSVFEYNGTGNSKSYLHTNPATGSYTVTPLAGYDGSSYVVKFDGSNDHIYNTTITQGSGPFTVEAWVYFSSSNLASAGIFNRAGNTTAKLIWKFNMHNEFVRIDFYSTNVQTNTSPLGKTVIGTAVVKDDKWHHIAGGYDGSDIFLYVDGNLQGKTSYAGLTLNTSSVPVVIGYDSCCGGRPFNGMIAEMRIWNSARTQQEIRDNMHKRISKDNSSMLAYYHFDNANGTTTYDSVTATSATLLNFNYNSGSGFIKSNPPFGPIGTFVTTSGAETSVGLSGSQVHATISSTVDSVNTIGLYSFGTPNSIVSDVPVIIADVRSQLTWGVQKKGSLIDTTLLVFDYSGTGISPSYAKLLRRASAAATWTDVSGQFIHDSVNKKFTRTGTTSSAEYSIGTSNADPLPVETTSFTVTANRMTAELKWSTASEVNNYGFEIEKRVIRNELQTMNWEKLGFVQGNGTTNAPKEYFFSDNNLNGGKYSYRLKQIDRDGKFKYSVEVEVTVGSAPLQFIFDQNYPNPFNPTTTIKFTIQVSGFTTLKVYDMLGKEVATLVNENLEAGVYHQKTFDASRLSSGVYFARLQSGNKILLKKMVLLK
ncbi:MAG: LamG-like jellyroll fold domain-containing protein, partial [Bacteroidota bacterium]